MKRSRQSKVRIRTAPERRISIAHNGRMKLVFTFFIVALALFALGAYLVFIVTGSGGESSKKVLANKADDGQELPFCRGAITDRYGTVLAESVQKYRVIMEPRNILLRDKKNYEATVEALTAVMGCDRDLVVKGIDENPDSYYVQTGRILTAEEKLNEVRRLDLEILEHQKAVEELTRRRLELLEIGRRRPDSRSVLSREGRQRFLQQCGSTAKRSQP
jgi:cell division protein FtsI/penicillin-binding protein 2